MPQREEIKAASLPLMRKTFIEAEKVIRELRVLDHRLFRLCGRLSLRHETGRPAIKGVRHVSSAYAEDFH